MTENQRGSLLMVAAMAAFALEDMFIKSAAARLPVGQVLIVFGLGGMLIFGVLARMRGEQIFGRMDRVIWVRSGFEIMGRLCFTLALALTSLTATSAILQATPLVVALGAAVFFNEQVGWRRWIAIFVGLFGVLLVLRPGLDGFEPASIFAVLGTIGFAGRDLATKASRPQLSNAQLGVFGFAVLVVSGLIALAWTQDPIAPTIVETGALALAIVFGVIAYSALTGAMRAGEVSVIAPFRYTRLVFAMILGILVFAERPDTMTLIGSAIIVSGGLYSMWRERVRR